MFATYIRLHLHVWADDTTVIRAAFRVIAPQHRTDRAKREARHTFYRRMLDYHHQHQALVRNARL